MARLATRLRRSHDHHSPMTLQEAMEHVLDGARQHRDTLVEAGNLDGVAALLSEAIIIVEQSRENPCSKL